MKTIHLHGYLAEKFGETFRFDVPSVRMALSALRSQLKGFRDAVYDNDFVIVFGPRIGGISLAIEEVNMMFGNVEELHIIPYLGGAGGHGGSTIKIVVGALMMTAAVVGAFFTGGASLALLGPTIGILSAAATTTFIGIGLVGISLVLAGISSVLTPRPQTDYGSRQNANSQTSFLFNGAVNTSQEGLPVQLVYGRIITGSQVISSGVSTEVLA